MSGFHTGSEFCAKCLEVSTKRALTEQRSPPPRRGPLGPLLVAVQENLVKLMRIPVLTVGEQKPSCLGASAEGAAIPKLSRTGVGMQGRVSTGIGYGTLGEVIGGGRQKCETLGSRSDMQTVYIFVQWGMLIEQLSMMDPKKPIQAVFLDVHQRQLPVGKQKVGGTALPQQHASAVLAPRATLAAVLSPMALGTESWAQI